jgi:glycosyltransferase involved in cell wall biosynthesis
MIKLSILIPSTFDRAEMLSALLSNLNNQIKICEAEKQVEVLTNIDDRTLTIGMKRNLLLMKAKGEYCVFIDDDDEVSDDYVYEILRAINDGSDVINFNGFMSTNGTNKENFEISMHLPYITEVDKNGVKSYKRYSNHLSIIKREIALKIMFPDIRFAEDYEYATKLKNSGLLKTETKIHKNLYHYKFISNKK